MHDFIGRLDQDIMSLKELLSHSSTEAICGSVRAHLLAVINSEKFKDDDRLMSPAKQLCFLLSLMLSTPEPSSKQEFVEDDWLQAKQLLNNIFGAYQLLFWPTKEEAENMNEEWFGIREVMMPTFLHYHNTALLASIQQISSRIERYCVPFDCVLKEQIGISATESLEIVKFLQLELQEQLAGVARLAQKERAIRIQIIDEADAESQNGAEFDALVRSKMLSSSYADIAFPMMELIKKLGIIDCERIKKAFPSTGEAYLQNYAIKRGAGPSIIYPTEKYVFESKPLVMVNDSEVNCPYPNKLYESVLSNCEEVMELGSSKESFLSHRDKVLEQEAAELLLKIVGADSNVLRSVYETTNSHLEHDIIIISGDKLLIVEVKASPPTEPFRDPEKAFTRIKRSFKSKSGIQYAFDQGVRVLRRLDKGEVVPLYDRKGMLVASLDPNLLTSRFCICVTRDDFGYLATNLSLLLEKESTDAYPWVINIWDLSQIKDAWSFFRWDTGEFYRYLSERVRCHGKVMGGDELEFLGAKIHHGSLEVFLVPSLDKIQLNPRYSDFFDDLYMHLNNGTPAPEVKIVKPVLMDVKKSFEKDQPVYLSDIPEKD